MRASFAVGLQQEGAQIAYALGQFKNQLIVYFNDSAQVWNVDPNPALNSLRDKIFGIGTRYPRGAASFASDNFFLADVGVRSITVNQLTDNLQDNDVGSPVDTLLVPTISAHSSRSRSISRRRGSTGSCSARRHGSIPSRARRRSAAWSKYTFPFVLNDITQLDNVTYLRSGDNVYKLDKNEVPRRREPDRGCGRSSLSRREAAGDPEAVHRHGCGARRESADPDRDESEPPVGGDRGFTITGDTRPGELTPVEVMSVVDRAAAISLGRTRTFGSISWNTTSSRSDRCRRKRWPRAISPMVRNGPATTSDRLRSRRCGGETRSDVFVGQHDPSQTYSAPQATGEWTSIRDGHRGRRSNTDGAGIDTVSAASRLTPKQPTVGSRASSSELASHARTPASPGVQAPGRVHLTPAMAPESYQRALVTAGSDDPNQAGRAANRCREPSTSSAPT